MEGHALVAVVVIYEHVFWVIMSVRTCFALEFFRKVLGVKVVGRLLDYYV